VVDDKNLQGNLLRFELEAESFAQGGEEGWQSGVLVDIRREFELDVVAAGDAGLVGDRTNRVWCR